MFAQIAGRHAVGVAGPSAASRMIARLVFSQGQQHNLARVEDRAQAHRDGLGRDGLFAEEVAGRVASGHRVERADARAAAVRC